MNTSILCKLCPKSFQNRASIDLDQVDMLIATPSAPVGPTHPLKCAFVLTSKSVGSKMCGKTPRKGLEKR
jgi:hypothetical protein